MPHPRLLAGCCEKRVCHRDVAVMYASREHLREDKVFERNGKTIDRTQKYIPIPSEEDTVQLTRISVLQ
jgi:hypothetical protein